MRIAASGVNPLDPKKFTMALRRIRAPGTAGCSGLDLAGTVETVGPGVTTFRPGDKVYGMTGGVGGLQGSLAEFAAVDGAWCADARRSRHARGAALRSSSSPLGRLGRPCRCKGRASRPELMAVRAALAMWPPRSRSRQALAYSRPALAGIAPSSAARRDVDRLPVGGGRRIVQRCTKGAGFDLVYDTVRGTTLDASFLAIRRLGHVVSCLGWGSHALGPLSFRAGTYSGVFTLLPLLTGMGSNTMAKSCSRRPASLRQARSCRRSILGASRWKRSSMRTKPFATVRDRASSLSISASPKRRRR